MKTYCQQELYIDTLRAELADKDVEITRLRDEIARLRDELCIAQEASK